MAYIDARFWDDPVADESSDCVRLWFWFMTGQNNALVPGLVVAGLATVAEQSKLAYPDAINAAERLVQVGSVKFDAKLRLFRVVNGPLYCLTPRNGDVIRSWFRRWEKLPESVLKYEHVDALGELALRGTSDHHKKAWVETFGHFSNRKPQIHESLQLGLAIPSLDHPPKPPVRSNLTDQDQDQDVDLKRIGSPDVEAAEPRGKGNGKPKGKGKSTGNGHDTLNGRRSECERLWALHNRLRREVIPGVRNLAATDENLSRIAERLAAGHSPEDCEHILFARASEILVLRRKGAKENLDKAVRFFNGATPWRSDPFEMYCAMPAPQKFREEVEARWRLQDAAAPDEKEANGKTNGEHVERAAGVGADEVFGMSLSEKLGIATPPKDQPTKEQR